LYRFVIVALLAAATNLAHAQVPINPLAQCLADSTSGKDRKELARWVFLAMAAHPEIQQFASPSAAAAQAAAHKTMAETVTRLLTVSCVGETRTAFKQGGSNAIQVAFQTLGQLAMQELMSNPNVGATMGAFERHIDQSRFRDVLGAR
jgi:hypothetical protein